MRVESIVDARSLAHVEREPKRFAAFANGLLIALQFLRRRSILLRDVLRDVLPLGRHVRIELERLKADVGCHLIANVLESSLQGGEPDHAPGARDIGDEIDLEASGHGAPVQRSEIAEMRTWAHGSRVRRVNSKGHNPSKRNTRNRTPPSMTYDREPRRIGYDT